MRFHTALLKLGKAANSTEFSLAKYASYLANPSRILDDAEMLNEWSSEIVKLAKLSVVNGDVDLAGLILVESLAAEFSAALVEELEYLSEEDFLDLDEDLLAEDSFQIRAEDLASILEAALDEAEEQEVVDDVFADIIAANFDEVLDADPEECGCAECTAASDFDSMHADDLSVVAALVRGLVKESFLSTNGKYTHPAMKNDPAPEAYASQWEQSFLAAAGESPYQLARFVASLTELCDDTMYSLIAKNSPSLDSYASASRDTIARAGTLLAVI